MVTIYTLTMLATLEPMTRRRVELVLHTGMIALLEATVFATGWAVGHAA